jgi:hypothetical protein
MSTPKLLTAVGLVLLILGGVVGLYSWANYPERTWGTFDLGKGYELRVWTHYPEDWVGGKACIYYHVTHGSDEVVPKTFLDVDVGKDISFKTVSADGGWLACVLLEQENRTMLDDVIMFDLRTQECWPGHRTEDNAGRGVPQERWAERFRKLAQENPGVAWLQEAVSAAR